MGPTVSVIVPCYNEQENIVSLLDAILAQTYPGDQMEVVIADGISQDRTREVIRQFAQAHPVPALRVVENARRTIPSGLNLAMSSAQGDIIVRLDGHSIPIPDYVEKCVEAIESERGANVGGVWLIRPGGHSWIARGIAAAAGHPLGAGDASYRLGGLARAVDTVPFGAFRRTLIDRIGGFDETLLTNEDYEFNVRIRRAGGIVWLDPRIRSTYVARSTLTALAKQYWRYGFWKLRMLIRYPGTLRLRQAVPALFVLGTVGLAVAALFLAPARMLLGIELSLYLVALLAGGIDVAIRDGDAGLIPGTMLAFATMHMAWGSGFWWSLISRPLGIHG